ncbi:MAG: FecR family protein [Candidatus Ozemobacteraceae bacterium]
MNCSTFLELLNEIPDHPLDTDAMAHASQCVSCRNHLAAEKRVSNGLTALSRLPFDRDLAPSILAKIRKDVLPGESPGIIERFHLLLSGRFFATFSLGFVLLICIVASWWVTHSHPARQDENMRDRPHETWMASLETGSCVIAGKTTISQAPFSLQNGEKLTIAPDGIVRLTLGTRARVRLIGAEITPASAGFLLDFGKAEVDVAPLKSKEVFRVLSPFGDITVIGTAFSLNATKDAVFVHVERGTVHIRSIIGEEKILSAGNDAVLSASQGVPGSSNRQPETPPQSSTSFVPIATPVVAPAATPVVIPPETPVSQE